MVQRENCNASCDQSNNEIFVQWISLAEDREMQKHHRKKFTGFGEDESDIVDMSERCVAERRCEGGCYGDEK